MIMNDNIGVVLVTFNRLEKLKVALRCFSLQIEKPLYMVVVDNASTDGTAEFLAAWQKEDERFEKIVLSLPVNSGGSGGFYEGLSFAQQKSADWIWVSDDDAFPQKECLFVAKNFIKNVKDIDDYSALCGSVYNHGQINTMHRRRTFNQGIRYRTIPVEVDEYSDNFLCNTFSYVGAILNKNKLKLAGLPQKDYFIWSDDTEHSLRMSKVGKIICLPQIKVVHDEASDSTSFSWKTYYGIRNRLDLMRRHFPKLLFLYQCFKFFRLGLGLFWQNRAEGMLYFVAVKDALLKKMGLHKTYKPGWKPTVLNTANK